MVTTMAAVSLTQQQYQQFIDTISGLEARMCTLRTHAGTQLEQIRVAEMVIQQLRAAGTNPTNPPPPFRAASQKQVTEGGAFKALTTYTETLPSITIGSSVRDESPQERMRDLLDYYSGSRDRSMKSKRAMCLSTGERWASAQQTWTGSTRNCTRCWPSRHLIRHWRPSSHLRKLKSRESLGGNHWNVKREIILDIEWRFSENR